MSLRDENDSSWRGRLVRANWRGFEFLTDSYETRGGHRLVVHEFPGSDVPVVENLGLKAGGHKLTAYFIGDNYDRERNKFLQCLTEKGAAWLNHPWLGQQWVQAQDWSVHESSDKGGYCTVSVDFAAGGRAPFAPSIDAVDTAFGAVQRLREAVTLGTPVLSVSALDALKQRIFVALEKLRKLISLAKLPLAWAGEVFDLIAQIKGTLNELLAIPGAYLNALHSLSNVLGTLGFASAASGTIRASAVPQLATALQLPSYAKAADTSDAVTDAQRLRGITALAKLAVPDTAGTVMSGIGATGSAVGGSGSGSSGVGVGGLSVADVVALRQAATEEQFARSQLLLVSTAEVALADYTSARARDAALGLVLGAVDAHLPLSKDAVFEALVNMRTSVLTALQAQPLATVQTRDVVHALPATTLAYLMAMPEQALLESHLVRHPLFVQGRVYG